MKKIAIILGMFSVVLWLSGVCLADPYYGPIAMVEADPLDSPVGGDTDVSFTVINFTPSWTIGEWNDSRFDLFYDESDKLDGIQVTKPDGDPDGFAADDFIPVTVVVPIPAAVWIFGAGLIGLVGIRRKIRN